MLTIRRASSSLNPRAKLRSALHSLVCLFDTISLVTLSVSKVKSYPENGWYIWKEHHMHHILCVCKRDFVRSWRFFSGPPRFNLERDMSHRVTVRPSVVEGENIDTERTTPNKHTHCSPQETRDTMLLSLISSFDIHI